MKKFKSILIAFVLSLTMLSFTGCETVYAATYDDVYTDPEISVSVITTYGTPIYVDGVISYYIYRNLYYYPFYYDNVLYYRSFYRPLPPRHHYHFGRPHRGDIGHHGHRPGHHEHRPGHHGYENHHGHRPGSDHGHGVRPGDHGNRPHVGNHNGNRPHIGNGSSHGNRPNPQMNHGNRPSHTPSMSRPQTRPSSPSMRISPGRSMGHGGFGGNRSMSGSHRR